MDRILDAGFKPRAAESVFIQSSTATRRHARRSTRPCRTSSPAPLQARAVVHSPLIESRRQVSKDGHAVLVDFEITRREGQGAGQGRPGASTPSQAAAGRPPRLLHRRDGRRQRPEGRHGPVRQGSRQGRDALPADHARHPARHVRGARRRGDPAAARAHGRVRARSGSSLSRATSSRCRTRCLRSCS